MDGSVRGKPTTITLSANSAEGVKGVFIFGAELINSSTGKSCAFFFSFENPIRLHNVAKAQPHSQPQTALVTQERDQGRCPLAGRRNPCSSPSRAAGHPRAPDPAPVPGSCLDPDFPPSTRPTLRRCECLPPRGLVVPSQAVAIAERRFCV